MGDNVNSALRRRAAVAIMRHLRDRAARAELAELGHRSGQPLIVVLDTDTIGDVVGRLVDESPTPPALVFMFRPEHEDIVVFTFHPAPSEGAPGRQSAGHTATIGMLYDVMVANGALTMDVSVTWGPGPMSATLSRAVPVHA